MIGCLWTRVRKQPIITIYFEFENELKFYNLEARPLTTLDCRESMLYPLCLMEFPTLINWTNSFQI